MRLNLRLFGLDIIDLDLSTDPPSPEPDEDWGHELAGGTTASDRIDPGPTDRYLGFTNGREVDDEPD